MKTKKHRRSGWVGCGVEGGGVEAKVLITALPLGVTKYDANYLPLD